MAFWTVHVWCLEQFRRLLFNSKHITSLLYIRRQVREIYLPQYWKCLLTIYFLFPSQIFCHMQTFRISFVYDKENRWNDDCQRLVPTSSYFLYTHLPWLVHNRRASRMAQDSSKRMHFCREQSLCRCVKFHIVLDTRHCHDHDVLSYFQVNIYPIKLTMSQFTLLFSTFSLSLSYSPLTFTHLQRSCSSKKSTQSHELKHIAKQCTFTESII